MRLISCHDGKLLTLDANGRSTADGKGFPTGLDELDALAPAERFARGAVHEILSETGEGRAIFFAMVLARAACGITPALDFSSQQDEEREMKYRVINLFTDDKKIKDPLARRESRAVPARQSCSDLPTREKRSGCGRLPTRFLQDPHPNPLPEYWERGKAPHLSSQSLHPPPSTLHPRSPPPRRNHLVRPNRRNLSSRACQLRHPPSAAVPAEDTKRPGNRLGYRRMSGLQGSERGGGGSVFSFSHRSTAPAAGGGARRGRGHPAAPARGAGRPFMPPRRAGSSGPCRGSEHCNDGASN